MLIRKFIYILSDEAQYYRKLRKFFQTPTEIMEVFKVLIFNKDAPQPLFDGATKTKVCDFLLGYIWIKIKNMFLSILMHIFKV